MRSVSHQLETTKKSIVWQTAKITSLLLISLGAYLFSVDFPFYKVFDPESIGWKLWVSYANDLLQPFALYFLLCLSERWMKTWQIRAIVALAIPILLEVVQLLYQIRPWPVAHYFGAFDPLDILMYIIGVGLAVIIERKLFAKLFKEW